MKYKFILFSPWLLKSPEQALKYDTLILLVGPVVTSKPS